MGKIKLSIILFLLAALQQLNAQVANTTDSTYIDVYAEGVGAGKVKLVGVYGDQNYLADSSLCDANGHFVLRRKSPLPSGFYTFLVPGNKSFSFMMDKEQKFTIRLNINDVLNTLKTDKCLDTELLYDGFRFQGKQEAELGSASETMRNNPPNSEAHIAAKARQTKLLDERKAYQEGLYKQYPNSFYNKFKKAGANPDLIDFRKPNGDLDTLRQLLDYRNRFFDNVDFSDTRLLNTPVVANKLRRYVKELTPQQPDSLIKSVDPLIRKVLPYKEYFKFFANWIAIQYENTKTTVMDGEAVYVHVIKNYFKPGTAFWSNQKEIDALQKHVYEMEASLMGRKGPDVLAKDVLDGKMKSIYEISSPLVVVFMFSPDCEHCQKDAPSIVRIANKWKDKGVQFFGIAIGAEEMETKIRDFANQHKFPFPVVNDPTNRAIYAKYFVDITPELYILNKDRTIVAKNLHAEQLEEVFERELKKVNRGK